jgi:hypothetical protein
MSTYPIILFYCIKKANNKVGFNSLANSISNNRKSNLLNEHVVFSTQSNARLLLLEHLIRNCESNGQFRGIHQIIF